MPPFPPRWISFLFFLNLLSFFFRNIINGLEVNYLFLMVQYRKKVLFFSLLSISKTNKNSLCLIICFPLIGIKQQPSFLCGISLVLSLSDFQGAHEWWKIMSVQEGLKDIEPHFHGKSVLGHTGALSEALALGWREALVGAWITAGEDTCQWEWNDKV